MKSDERKIAHSYAKAFVEWLEESRVSLDEQRQAVAQLESLQEAVAGVPDWHQLMSPGGLPVDQQQAVMESLAAKISLPAVSRFIALIGQHQRYGLLATILAQAVDQWKTRHLIADAQLTSAVPTTPEFRARIASLLAKRLGFQEVVVKEAVDSSLIAGFRVRVKDRVFDMTWRHRLGDLEKQLIQSS